MSKRQLITLFVGSIVLYTIGNGLLPLLPVYATRLEAEPLAVGYYLSFAYLALALGNVAAGWFSDGLQRRKELYVIAGLLAIPGTWLMGQVSNLWYLAALTAVVWFLIGVGLALTNALTGLFAEKHERGRIFGLLALSIGLGSLLGGLTLGKLVDAGGYPRMFTLLAAFLGLWPLAGLFLEDRVVGPPERAGPAHPQPNRGKDRARRLSLPFFLLLLANLLAMSAYFSANLGRSLAMNTMGFSSDKISSTLAVSGAVTLPLPALIGWLSDRLDRRWLVAFCYLAGAGGLAVLALATVLWHFWVALGLLAVLVVSYSIGAALVTDLIPPETLGQGIALFSATTFGGGIVGFTGTGYAIEQLGIQTTLLAGAGLPLLGILLLFLVRRE